MYLVNSYHWHMDKDVKCRLLAREAHTKGYTNAGQLLSRMASWHYLKALSIGDI